MEYGEHRQVALYVILKSHEPGTALRVDQSRVFGLRNKRGINFQRLSRSDYR